MSKTRNIGPSLRSAGGALVCTRYALLVVAPPALPPVTTLLPWRHIGGSVRCADVTTVSINVSLASRQLGEQLPRVALLSHLRMLLHTQTTLKPPHTQRPLHRECSSTVQLAKGI